MTQRLQFLKTEAGNEKVLFKKNTFYLGHYVPQQNAKGWKVPTAQVNISQSMLLLLQSQLEKSNKLKFQRKENISQVSLQLPMGIYQLWEWAKDQL